MINKKLIIKVNEIRPEWLAIFNEKNILHLKICNQPLVDYYLHFARHLGVKEVIICNPEYDSQLWEYEKTNYFSFKIKCEVSPLTESLDKFKRRNLGLVSGHHSINILEPVFIYFDLKNSRMREIFRENKDYRVDSGNQNVLVTREINSVEDFYNLSMSIIEKYHTNYFFREFTIKQNGVFFGRGANVKNLHSVKGSCLIGSYSYISSEAFLKKNCIVPSFSTIAAGSEVEGTIFYDPVNVVCNSSFKNKIVIRGIIFDSKGSPLVEKKEAKLEFSPPFEFEEESYRGRFVAVGLFFVLLLPSILIELMFINTPKVSEEYLDKSNADFSLKRLREKSLFSDFYKILNFSMLGGLLKVVNNELRLIGQIGTDTPSRYRVSLYDCSKFVMDKDFRIGSEMFDSFYRHKKNFFYDILVVTRYYLSKTMQLIR